MTTLTIDIYNEEEQKAIIALLDKLKVTYRTNEDSFSLTKEQQEEILRRERDFKDGKIQSEPWDKIKLRFART